MAPEWPETPDDKVDPALAPLIEAGEGESEGFELAEADLIEHEDRMGHGPLNRLILQRIIEQGKTAKKLGYDPKYCAFTMVDLHALMEQNALENPYPS